MLFAAAAALSPAVVSAEEPSAAQQRADRTVQIDMGLIWFRPNTVTVEAGETIRFVVRNTTDHRLHDFTIGTPAEQERRRDRIAKVLAALPEADQTRGIATLDTPNSVAVPPGESRELTWTFATAEPLEFGCNMPGHYEYGMKGVFEIRLRPGQQNVPVAQKDEPQVSVVSAEPTGSIKAQNKPSKPSVEPVTQGSSEEGTVVAALAIKQANARQPSGNPNASPDENTDRQIKGVLKLAEGHALMAEGKVSAARHMFAESFQAGNNEAALAIARSYDPRVVAQLKRADAKPNIDMARKWYQAWHRGAVALGEISSDVKLEWLIRRLPKQ